MDDLHALAVPLIICDHDEAAEVSKDPAAILIIVNRHTGCAFRISSRWLRPQDLENLPRVSHVGVRPSDIHTSPGWK